MPAMALAAVLRFRKPPPLCCADGRRCVFGWGCHREWRGLAVASQSTHAKDLVASPTAAFFVRSARQLSRFARAASLTREKKKGETAHATPSAERGETARAASDERQQATFPELFGPDPEPLSAQRRRVGIYEASANFSLGSDLWGHGSRRRATLCD